MRSKAILAIILSLVLSGCASYPYTLIEDGQGVYYEDPADVYGDDGYVSSGYLSYSDLRYYPWWSLDYYYLGAAFYSPWYGYYSPYFYPHYFSVWYSPWYWGPDYGFGRYSAWADPYWYQRYRRHHHAYPTRRAHEPGSDYVAGPVTPGAINRYETRDNREPGIRRTRVSSPGNAGSGTMTVVSPTDRKIGPSKAGPVRGTGISASVNPAGGAAVAPRTAPPAPTRSTGIPRRATPQQSATRTSGSAGQRSMRVEKRRSATPSPDRDQN